VVDGAAAGASGSVPVTTCPPAPMPAGAAAMMPRSMSLITNYYSDEGNVVASQQARALLTERLVRDSLRAAAAVTCRRIFRCSAMTCWLRQQVVRGRADVVGDDVGRSTHLQSSAQPPVTRMVDCCILLLMMMN
jgi:hypothetical protein